MGLFRRRTEEAQPSDRLEWVISTARRILAERGIETTIAHGAQPEDVSLAAAGGATYPLFNVFAKTAGATADEASRIIAEHMDYLLQAGSDPSLDQLSAEQLRAQVRTRLLTDGEGGDNEPTFRYAPSFSEGLIIALCVDFPQSVQFITDDTAHDLALTVDELYAFGQLNTDREPVDERFEPSPGITVITGDSLFIASKSANLPAAIGATEFGTLFTVPHRHMLITLPITGPETATALEYLVRATMQVLSNGPAPGGVLSRDVHFSRNSEVSRVSSIDDEGAVTITVDERLQHALDEAAR